MSLRAPLPSAFPFQESTLGKATWPVNVSWPQLHHKNNRTHIVFSSGRVQNTLWEKCLPQKKCSPTGTGTGKTKQNKPQLLEFFHLKYKNGREKHFKEGKTVLLKTKTFHFWEKKPKTSQGTGRFKWLVQNPTWDLHLHLLSHKWVCLQLNCNVNSDFGQILKKWVQFYW